MARRWPPPCYETEDEVGLPHERQFTIACLVSIYREIGCGKSKKIAKRLAANKMWQKLQTLPIDPQDDAADEVRSICSCKRIFKCNYLRIHTISEKQK